MKFFLVILFGVLSQIGIGQSKAKTIIAAINQSDGATITRYFNEDTDVTILDNDGIGSEGKSLVTNFFKSNKTTNFILKHEGTSKLGNVYRIGNLTTTNGKYRVTFFISEKGTNIEIIQFKIAAI